VDGGEPRRALVGAEVWRKDTLLHASPPEELASPARRPRARRSSNRAGISTTTTTRGHG
jgi:hypothetical protein